MRDDRWIQLMLREAAPPPPAAPTVDVADRVLLTLAGSDPPGTSRSMFLSTAVGCLIAGAAVAYAAQAWSTATDPLAASMAPVRMALTDG